MRNDPSRGLARRGALSAWLVPVAVVGVGCFHVPGRPTPDVVQGGVSQGPALHGTGRFERLHFSLGTDGQVKGGELVGLASNPLTALGPEYARYTFTLTPGEKHRDVHGLESGREYEVGWRYRPAEGPSGELSGTLCPGGGRALVAQGYWGDDGSWQPDAQVFSFACLPRKVGRGVSQGGGAIARCIDWGYAPWGQGAGGGPTGAAELHLACTGVAMADYCGTSQPNTVDGIPLLLFNGREVPVAGRWSPAPGRVASSPPGAPGFAFEAAWGVEEVKGPCEGQPSSRRLRGRLVCMTRRRWSTLPPDGLCPRRVPDPRTASTPLASEGPFFCEDRPAEQLKGADAALLFSYSRFLDAGLYRFKLQDGGFLTTTQVETDPSRIAPRVGLLEQEATPEWPAFEGTVLSSQDVPWERLGVSPPPGLTPLYLCRDGGRYVTASTCPEGQYVRLSDGRPQPEGYVLAETPAAPAGPALYLRAHGPGGLGEDPSPVTTTDHSLLSSPLGAGTVKRLGYLPRLRP